MPCKFNRLAVADTLVGYARVSTDDQETEVQVAELKAAGCAVVHQEHASGKDRKRPVLALVMQEIAAGQTLVVVRLDRLARSVSHLLAIIEQLEAKGAHFRSLHDPIDTTTPQGMFTLQVIGAMAEFERALIAERTKAGLAVAKSQGRVGGNPALRMGDAAAIQKIQEACKMARLTKLIAGKDEWFPTVEHMRPQETWGDVARMLNHNGGTWTAERLRRSVKTLVQQGLASPRLMERAPASTVRYRHHKLARLVRGIAIAAPKKTLQQIASQLEAMHERTPRGGTRWHPSSVRHLLQDHRERRARAKRPLA